MAKTSSIERNKKRMQLVEAGRKARLELKEIIRTDEEKRDEAIVKLQKRKRDEMPSRIRNRCRECGRPKGTYRKFGLCRIHFRQAVMRGDAAGVRKASW